MNIEKEEEEEEGLLDPQKILNEVSNLKITKHLLVFNFDRMITKNLHRKSCSLALSFNYFADIPVLNDNCSKEGLLTASISVLHSSLISKNGNNAYTSEKAIVI